MSEGLAKIRRVAGVADWENRAGATERGGRHTGAASTGVSSFRNSLARLWLPW